MHTYKHSIYVVFGCFDLNRSDSFLTFLLNLLGCLPLRTCFPHFNTIMVFGKINCVFFHWLICCTHKMSHTCVGAARKVWVAKFKTRSSPAFSWLHFFARLLFKTNKSHLQKGREMPCFHEKQWKNRGIILEKWGKKSNLSTTSTLPDTFRWMLVQAAGREYHHRGKYALFFLWGLAVLLQHSPSRHVVLCC